MEHFVETQVKRDQILKYVYKLKEMHLKGVLGGEEMPEDQNPGLDLCCSDNYHYFTLPMALNYQRNSYVLWASAKKTYEDSDTNKVFQPVSVIKMSDDELRTLLTKYKVALQPNKQTEVWKRICETVCELYEGDIRNLFKISKEHIPTILELVQKLYKPRFPYLSGQKICNYWLYVMSNYTDVCLTGKEALNIAPDTHVVQATIKLGIIDQNDAGRPDIQTIVSDSWKLILEGTGIFPIDIHTPLWLWSRSGFKRVEL